MSLPRSSSSSSLSLAASIVVGRWSPAVVVVVARFALEVEVLWSIHVYQECDQISVDHHCSHISFSPTISYLSKPGSMEPRNNTVSPQPDTPTTRSSGIKRHHTISTGPRIPRTDPRLTNDGQASWNGGGDEAVDPDWVGGVGAVGEKSSLHRQASLPTRHPRRKSLLSCIGIPIYHFPGDLADYSDSLEDPARWNLDPSYAQQSLYHRRPRRGGRRLGSFGTRGRPQPRGR